jgi:DNA-binding PadR family transcriptional regulator
LLAILRPGDRAYGVTIRTEIFERAGRTVAPGASYSALDRLEDKALVKARVGEPTLQRGGRAKRFFPVTPSGAALKLLLIMIRRSAFRLKWQPRLREFMVLRTPYPEKVYSSADRANPPISHRKWDYSLNRRPGPDIMAASYEVFEKRSST